MPTEIYDLVKRAILERLIIVAVYDGCRREMCPHVIGRKDGKENALFFQFAGDSRSGLPPGGEWRCLHLAELTDVSLRTGLWRAGEGRPGIQTCVDEVDAQVPGSDV